MSPESRGDPPHLLSITEAAIYLNVPEGWLRKKVSAKGVPFTRIGKHVRFTPEHLAAIVANGQSPSAGPRARGRPRSSL